MTIFEIIASIISFFGAIGTIAGAVYLFFKFLGEKWLTAKFDERLAAYKHAQQRELEQLKFEINALMDRTIKLHQHEFEVLPEIWGRLVDAYHRLVSTTSAFQQTQDLDGMQPQQLEEFIASSSLANWQKEELRKTPRRTDYYFTANKWQKIDAARDADREFITYFTKSGIFIPEPIKDKISELGALIWDALSEYQINQRFEGMDKTHTKLEAFSAKGPALLKSIEKEVQGRLWNSATPA